ncbi:50S ribosomal protein L5 [Candidatus Gottesmanbacteria bacterium RIFCSPLOWO2_01_FULL_49_10]|uniref:Large ribosomal subunit protein uL5 n=1 Tax=Candidatus Gottesmanbacteria bacterium RIFCSPLOWO2_01_FULL_49_10 TaxID=1798396 RepID=A0A1F6AXF5_9BACT|nr:MAG: 50S ribosomal protein L5 [Microgenomates group bacterium GW2011_GWA2_47_8]OGG29359.1 MAG: 50S ribosomal protein L5 [Candidatus Gottesmanbacteria bacterium RIFCSPLOWO2_01_FULL_49_10]
MQTLYEKYKQEIIPTLMREFAITNPMATPKLTKIVVNCGLGEALTDKKVIERMTQQLSIITGQRPSVTRAKRAISSFKLRAGDPIGLKVTLRGRRMYDFFTKFVSLALPRVRDFRGVPKSGFDGHGNYTIGLEEQTIFPELEYSLVDKTRGFEITFVTSAGDDERAGKLLALLGMPFEK